MIGPRASAAPRAPGLLRRPAFRWYLASDVAGTTGYALYAIAVVWLAVGPHGSYAVAGAVLALEFGIYAMSFLAGPVLDRLGSPRAVAVVGYAVQGGVAAALGLLARAGPVPAPILLGLVAALSVAWDFTWTATNILLPRLVGADELLPATGLVQAAGGATQVAGAAAGAVLLAVSGPAAALLLYAAFNAAALLALAPVPPARTEAPPTAGFARAFADGWRYVARGPGRPLAQLAAFYALEGFVTAGPALLVALEANRGGGDAAAVYGLLATALAVGGVVGMLLFGAANPRRRLGAWLLGSAGVEAALLAVVPIFGSSLVAATAVWLAVGLVEAIVFNGVIVYVQATAPPDVMGRALTDTYLFRGTSRAAGAFVVGALAVSVAFGPIALGLAAFLGAVCAVSAIGLPAVRRLAF